MGKRTKRKDYPFRVCRRVRPIEDARAILGELAPDGYAVEDLWVEVDFDERWRAAFRLAKHGQGHVISELRILPADDWPGREPGTWRARALGRGVRHLDGKDGPNGARFGRVGHGLRAATVRQVPFDVLQRYAASVANEALKLAKDLPLDVEIERSQEAARRLSREAERESRATPAGWPDRRYAQIAAAYVEQLRAGSRQAVIDTAGRFRSLSVPQVRDAIHTARKRGILTPTGQGLPGGALTDYGRSLRPAPKRAPKKKGS